MYKYTDRHTKVLKTIDSASIGNGPEKTNDSDLNK